MINQSRERESRALLTGVWMGRLGCGDHDKPYIAPIIIFSIRMTNGA